MMEDKSKQPLNQQEKDYLLKLTRETLNYYFQTGKLLIIDDSQVPERLKNKQGVFVTLEKKHQLRGCIGYLEPLKPLYQAVMENVINAAVKDWRFPPVTKDELQDIKIEISVLSVPKLLEVPALERPKILKPLVDGVILEEGLNKATYLPQVWEQLSDPNIFLGSLCEKGGWPENAWQDEKLKLYTYQAEVFKEK